MTTAINQGESSAAAASRPAEFTSPSAQQPQVAPQQPQSAHQQAQAQAQHTPAQPAPYAQYPAAYGQQYAPYQQYGYYAAPAGAYASQPAWPQTGTEPPQETKSMGFVKMGLHGIALVFSICAFGMGLSFVSTPDPYMAVIACPVPVMGLIWSAIELIVRLVRKFKPGGIHPGGQVAATLILWLAAAIVGPIEAIFTVTIGEEHCDYEYSSGRGYYEETNCRYQMAGRRGLWVAIVAFTLLLWAIYFTLFVMACIDTARHNAAKRAGQVVMVMNPWGAQGGWQQMPQYAPVPEHPQPSVVAPQRGQAVDTPYATPMEEGKQVEERPAHGVHEFYGAR